MIGLGALSVCLAVVSLGAAVRRDSAIQQRLARLAPAAAATSRWLPVSQRDLGQSGLAGAIGSQSGLVMAKLISALLGLSLGAFAGVATSLGPLPALALAYAGFVGPSLIVERRAAARRGEADRSLGIVIERLEALASAGRPPEAALVAIARRPTGALLLDAALGRAADAYALGAPLFRALIADARSEGLERLATFAADLERARDLGRGSLMVIRDARDTARSDERARSLDAAAQVESKLMLVLVLCYLPALLLLVVIPLFLTLLDGLFG